MRVLFLPWGQPSHYYHQVPLAWAFRAAGHDIRVAAQPGVLPAVQSSGLTFSAIGRGYDFEPETMRMETGARAHLANLKRLFASPIPVGGGDGGPDDRRRRLPLAQRLAPHLRTALAMAPDLDRLARSWRPDLVIADPFVLAAPIVAHVAGAVLLHHSTGAAVNRRTGVFPGSGLPVSLWPAELTELFERYGVPAEDEPAVGFVDTCPEAVQFPGIPARIPGRFVPYNGPGEAPDWLLTPPERPRVCVTWGLLASATSGDEGFLVPRVLDALSRLDVEVVVTVSAADRKLLGEPRAGARFLENLPLHLILPSCALLVHQGGGGAVLTAASYGVPQLMLTGLMAHLANATRLETTGAGVNLDWADAAGDTLTAAFERALGDEVRAAAARLRATILDQPSPADLVPRLESLTAAARAGGQFPAVSAVGRSPA